MENKVLNRNLAEIKRYDSALYNEILSIKNLKASFELIKTQKDEYNLSVNSYPLHSQEGAQEEAKNIVDKLERLDEKNSIRIVFGLGLGYLADEFIQRSEGYTIIYEPNLDILRSVLEILEFQNQLKNPKVFICKNKEKLNEHIGRLSDKTTLMTVSFLNSYWRFYKPEIEEIAQEVNQSHKEKVISRNTINFLSKLATLNTLLNLDNIAKTPSVGELKDVYKDKTALVLSAGPSLSRNIETIKKHREKYVIFAVGPALKLLAKNNVTPDFVCIIEAQDVRGQIEGMDLSQINLIHEPFSHSYLWEAKPKKRFLFFSKNNFLNAWCARHLNINIGHFETLGTVSYCALSCATEVGCKRIILCGQDLAFSDGECYAQGSSFAHIKYVFNEETKQYDFVSDDLEALAAGLWGSENAKDPKYIEMAKGAVEHRRKTFCTTEGQNGEILPTQVDYKLFITCFEKFASLNKNKYELINSSIGGAKIEGFETIPLEDAIKRIEDFPQKLDFGYITKTYDPKNLTWAKEEFQKDLLNAKKYVQEALDLQTSAVIEFKRRKVETKNTLRLQERVQWILRELTLKYLKSEPMYYLCISFINKITDDIKQQPKIKPQECGPLLENEKANLEELLETINFLYSELSDK